MSARPLRVVGIICLLLVVSTATVWAASEVNPWSKMGSFLQAQLAAKMKFLETGSRRDMEFLAKSKIGVDDSRPDRQKVILYFDKYPSQGQLIQLKRMQVKVYPDTWIPPMANHPQGFMIAEISVSKAEDVARRDFVRRMSSAETLRFPHNDQATSGANCNSMWSQGVDGSGVVVCIHDSGLDSTHADIPTLVAGKDYGQAPDSLDDTIGGASLHGTHVAGSAVGRGTLSGGTYKGAAPGADLVFLKIGGDSDSDASISAMIAAVIASVDTYGVDIISVSYGGLGEFNDGSEADCQTQDWAVEQGVLYVTSAGNTATAAGHYSGMLTSKAEGDTIQMTVDEDVALQFILTCYDGPDTSDRIDYNLELFDASYATVPCSAYTQTQSPRGTESQYFESKNTVTSGTYYAVVTLNAPPKPLIGYDYHLYSIDYDVWFPVGADQNYTLVGGACADQTISVGAWVSRYHWQSWCDGWYWYGQTQDDIASFSSRGPRIDGAGPQLPFITAGGSSVASCWDENFPWYNQNIIDNDGVGIDTTCPGPADYIIAQGTSQSCPIAAGVCALLLEHNPSLTPQQVKDILIDNAITDSYTGAVPNDNWGYGKISATIDMVAPARIADLAVTSMAENSIWLGWTAPGDDGSAGTASGYDIRYANTLPTKADTGAWWDSATQVTGEPTPAAQGDPDSMEVTSLSPGTMYYFAIKALDEHFNAGEISDIVGEKTLAVTLSSFAASSVPEGILVKWSTASEKNSKGYHLSRSMKKEGPFDFLTFIDGAGNSASAQNYHFLDKDVEEGVTYWYLLESEDISGERDTFGPVEVTADQILVPKTFALHQNYPNPFNPMTHIRYELAKDVPVSLNVYNVRGQHVVTLVHRDQKAGYYEVDWAGVDQRGRDLASGVYFYRLDAGERVFTRKMVLLK